MKIYNRNKRRDRDEPPVTQRMTQVRFSDRDTGPRNALVRLTLEDLKVLQRLVDRERELFPSVQLDELQRHLGKYR